MTYVKCTFLSKKTVINCHFPSSKTIPKFPWGNAVCIRLSPGITAGLRPTNPTALGLPQPLPVLPATSKKERPGLGWQSMSTLWICWNELIILCCFIGCVQSTALWNLFWESQTTDSLKMRACQRGAVWKSTSPNVSHRLNVMLSREVQPWKALSPMCVTDSLKVRLAKETQSEKALAPMWVTDSANVMLSREVQPWKALCPMCVTDSPKVMLAREVHLEKA